MSQAGGAPTLLGRVRLLFCLFALVNVLLIAPLWLGVPMPDRLVGGAASVMLAWLWTRVLRRGRFGPALRAAETVLLYLLISSAPIPEATLGVFYVGLYYGALYGSRTTTLLRSVLGFAALLAGFTHGYGPQALTDPSVITQAAGAVLSSLVMSLLLAAILRQAASEQAKDEFLSMVSHELRTPTAAVLGLLETIQLHRDRLDVTTTEQLLARARANAVRQHRLIEDLLGVSRLMDGSLEASPTPVRLRSVVDEVAEELDLPFDVHVDVHPDHVVEMDRGHLTQILTNLLSNAGKYGAPPVDVGSTGDPSGTVTLTLRDHGDGVPPDFAPHLYERFSQASTGDRRTSKGVGLGLWIAQSLAHANRAVLRHDPAVLPGACFRLTMLAVRPDPDPSATEVRAPVGAEA